MFIGRAQAVGPQTSDLGLPALDVILSGGEAGARDRTTVEASDAADYTTLPAAQLIPPTASLRPAVVRS